MTHIVPDDFHDALRVAWAEHIGVTVDDNLVYGWPSEFDHFAAGWYAHEAEFPQTPHVYPDGMRHQND